MDKPLRELIEIIHFTESVAAKIHGVLDDAEIYRIIRDEFGRSERYAASILLLTDDVSELKVVETSAASKNLDRLEKAFGLRLRDYRIDVEKSTTYRQVIRDGKTVRVNAGDLLQELLPRRLAYLISRAMGYERRSMVATPLYRRGKIMGALAISSPQLVDYFIPSVKNLARHVSTALELACEYVGRSKAEQQLRESERRHRDLVEQSLTAILIVQGFPPQIVFANQGAAEILGYTTDELTSLSPKEAMTIISPIDQRKSLELYRSRLEGNRTQEG